MSFLLQRERTRLDFLSLVSSFLSLYVYDVQEDGIERA